MINNAIDVLVKQIANSIDEKSKTLPFDRTFPSVIHSVNGNGYYSIAFEGKLRKVQSALPNDLKIGQMVWVKIPEGKLRNMHICGIRRN